MRIYIKLIIIFLALIIIPVLIVSYMTFFYSKNAIKKEILSKINVIANQGLDEVESFLSERESDLLILEYRDIYKSALPVLNQFYKNRTNPSYIKAKEEIDARFAIINKTHKYTNLMLANIEGTVIYVFNPEYEFKIGSFLIDKENLSQKLKDKIYFVNVNKNTKEKNLNILNMTGLVYEDKDKDKNKIIGMVHLEIDINKINNLIQNNPVLGESWETLLFKKTPDNKVLFLSCPKYEKKLFLSKTISIGGKDALPAQRALLGENGFGLSIDYRGKKVLAAWRPIKSLGWALVSKIDDEEAFLPIKKLKNLLFIIILATIVLSILIALPIAKTISDPINKLRKKVEIIGRGNLDYKLENISKDEIGQLSLEFDKMTQNLKKTTTSIDILNKEIIERKNAEDKLKQAFKEEVKTREILSSMLEDNNQIREKLEKYIEELKRIQDIMIKSEKMVSLGKLASEIAHEFNNPLMIISGNAQVSLMSEAISDDIKNNLQIILEESQRAKDIIRRLLKFSRPGRGETKKVDINKSIDTIVSIVEQQFKLANINIKKDFEENLSTVSINEQKMHEVFMNLMNNAKDSMPCGGTITIKTSLDKNYLRIDFKDTGCGMSDDVKKKIFDPFFTTKDEGTGLGLVICFNIVTSYNGELKFESELNKGTTFTINLPIGDKEIIINV